MNQYILLDIGNTNIKYAESTDGIIVSSKITQTNKYKDLEKMVTKFKNVFISSVVPEINTYFESLNINSYFVSHDNITNINFIKKSLTLDSIFFIYYLYTTY